LAGFCLGALAPCRESHRRVSLALGSEAASGLDRVSILPLYFGVERGSSKSTRPPQPGPPPARGLDWLPATGRVATGGGLRLPPPIHFVRVSRLLPPRLEPT